MEHNIFKKLTTTQVSELLFLMVIILFVSSVMLAQAQSNILFRLAILPPPPPRILSIIGDTQHRSVVILGQSAEKDALINIYNIADPSIITTKTNPDGSFAVVLGETQIQPGETIFVATAVIHGNYVTDPGNRVSFTINHDYSVIKNSAQDDSVYIGDSDVVTTQLASTLTKGAATNVVAIPASSIPNVNLKSQASQRLQVALFIVLFALCFSLLRRRAVRKELEHTSFFKLGRGFYPHPLPHTR